MLSRYNTADAASPNAPGAEWNQGCFFNNRAPYMQSATQTGTSYANGPFLCATCASTTCAAEGTCTYTKTTNGEGTSTSAYACACPAISVRAATGVASATCSGVAGTTCTFSCG